jgi:pSer/pThr/pTyr-binding forkhead associated (FHA) protein
MKKIIGRDFKQCDYTIYDPEKRVSRVHLVVEKNEKGFVLYDESSANGTYVNGIKIPHKEFIQIGVIDKVTLSLTYNLNLFEVFDDDRTSVLNSNRSPAMDDDATKVMVGSTSNSNSNDDDATRVLSGTKSLDVDADKTMVKTEEPKRPATNSDDFITIGRSKNNKIVLSNNLKISGEHCKIRCNDNSTIEILDKGSTYGTFVNNQKLEHNKIYRFSSSVKVNLANELTLDLKKIFPNLVINSGQTSQNNKMKLDVNGKKVVIDSDKTTIGEVLEFETLPFTTIGRKTENKIVISHPKVSGLHCKIRLLNPMMFEIIDLGSTNGTFANKEKLTANKSYVFPSNTQISLGVEYPLNLTKILIGMVVIETPKPIQNPVNPNSLKPISKEEMSAFTDLESIWDEYIARQHQVGSVANNWTLGGSAIGAIASMLIPGGALISIGSGLIGRYLGSQKAKEIKTDMNYENMFLETYACPRCKESFQKKPWVTIRECYKCKIKFRE